MAISEPGRSFNNCCDRKGVLLEIGFDTVMPNVPIDISFWALKKAIEAQVPFRNNMAMSIPCYDLRYTFDEGIRTHLKSLYKNSKGLYHFGQPDFDNMISYIVKHLQISAE